MQCTHLLVIKMKRTRNLFFFLLPVGTKDTVLANKIEPMLSMTGLPDKDFITDTLRRGGGCFER